MQATVVFAHRQSPCQGATTPAIDTAIPVSNRAGRKREFTRRRPKLARRLSGVTKRLAGIRKVLKWS
ncbi:hypothetical protein GW17_00034671 [Ensete ventricosum]|nr:hypothetical protein GW17_00034671 [Ensete ventricosum]